jgi:hypothetical protein
MDRIGASYAIDAKGCSVSISSATSKGWSVGLISRAVVLCLVTECDPEVSKRNEKRVFQGCRSADAVV